MKLSFRSCVMHNEPRYAYPAAYKTTDDLLHHSLNRMYFNLLDHFYILTISPYMHIYIY